MMSAFWDFLDTLWDFLGTNTGKITALIAIFGFITTLVFSILTYYRHGQDKKLKAVADLRNAFLGGVGKEAKMIIESFWASNEGRRILLCNDYNQIRKHALTSAQDRNHGPYLHFIRNHYAEIARCVQNGRCDRKYACELYANGVHRFVALYEVWLDQESEVRNEDLKRELDYFVRVSCCRKLKKEHAPTNQTEMDIPPFV